MNPVFCDANRGGSTRWILAGMIFAWMLILGGLIGIGFSLSNGEPAMPYFFALVFPGVILSTGWLRLSHAKCREDACDSDISTTVFGHR